MILVDTSVWIDHFRRSEPGLVTQLEGGAVLAHPMVTGELACGNLVNREEILALLDRLPQSAEATHAEALVFIQRNGLMNSVAWELGLGYA